MATWEKYEEEHWKELNEYRWNASKIKETKKCEDTGNKTQERKTQYFMV